MPAIDAAVTLSIASFVFRKLEVATSVGYLGEKVGGKNKDFVGIGVFKVEARKKIHNRILKVVVEEEEDNEKRPIVLEYIVY